MRVATIRSIRIRHAQGGEKENRGIRMLKKALFAVMFAVGIAAVSFSPEAQACSSQERNCCADKAECCQDSCKTECCKPERNCCAAPEFCCCDRSNQ